MSRTKTKRVYFSVRMPLQMAADIDMMRARDHLTRSEYFEEVFRRYLRTQAERGSGEK
jgi:metal-responsive CopG/Arc/MetJ family transcriptional regulator